MNRRPARWAGRRRAWLAGTLLAACVGVGGVTHAAPPATARRPSFDANARVARLDEDVARHEWSVLLEEPNPGAWRSSELRPAPVTQAVLDSDRVFREIIAERLEPIRRSLLVSALTPARRADFVLLTSWLERAHIERDERRAFEADPGRVMSRVDRAVRALPAGQPGALCRRLPLATRRLRAVPEALRATTVSLERPSRLAVETAIASLGGTLTLYRERIPAAVLECREPADVAALAEADTLAARALETFIEWLRGDALPRAGEAWSMGPEVYARWLRASACDTLALSAVRERAERELAAARREAAYGGAMRADSMRGAVADSLLDARASSTQRGAPVWLRVVLGRRDVALAWAAFAQALGGPSQARASAREARFAPTRLDLAATLAEIDLHAGGATLDDARHRLMADADLDSISADAEARSLALRPTRSLATVSAWQLEDLRSAAAARLGVRFSPRAFLQAAIEEGAVQAVVIREPLLRRLRAGSKEKTGQ